MKSPSGWKIGKNNISGEPDAISVNTGTMSVSPLFTAVNPVIVPPAASNASAKARARPCVYGSPSWIAAAVVTPSTSIAKLANHLKQQGNSVLLAAGDTFRAAAVEQLTLWAERLGIDIIKQTTGADPAAVAFDATAAAKARKVDYLILDTAGRLHTQKNLMTELEKIVRVVQKQLPDAPHETLLVLDGTTGQNAIRQASEFQKSAPVTGLILAKMDGTAKGGALFGIRDVLPVPVKFLGVGEGIDDLEKFVAKDYVDAILKFEDEGAA